MKCDHCHHETSQIHADPPPPGISGCTEAEAAREYRDYNSVGLCKACAAKLPANSGYTPCNAHSQPKKYDFEKFLHPEDQEKAHQHHVEAVKKKVEAHAHGESHNPRHDKKHAHDDDDDHAKKHDHHKHHQHVHHKHN